MPRKKAKSITPAPPVSIATSEQSSTVYSERPKTGVWATAKFNMTLDPDFVKQYVDLMNEGKSHEEALTIIQRNTLPGSSK